MDEEQPSEQKKSFFSGWRRLFGGRRRALSEEDLQAIIEESEEDGIINEEEGEMLASIFEFGETIVREVMVPRTDMVCCPVDAGMEDLLQIIIRSGHSRFPIFEGTTDRIVGVIYAKDLLRYWGRAPDGLSIRQQMRAPFFVPETKKIEELLKDFKSRRIHMAIAVDEFGGTSGLITIEDLIEEIVGDIQDEYDLEESLFSVEGPDSYLVDARLSLSELEEHLDRSLTDNEEIDTLGGYLCHLFGHVPVVGETIEDAGLQMTVLEADERRISKVRLVVTGQDEDEA
ncbi:HlyC/CorC family transporter [Geothermobacter hydrogeniphilus]|uniref:HlyC/CorC family transporter n=1 Tax=Geothermobacter hydrogeniphilus TaxID=1969733 RepID=A0A2K2HCK7_9BACT|nr:hemolysin family protein [Geothermobacter hydrogeniphilus]PNU20969.1 HlyC/CorC family transporter [Geothermobacter hydrogeniphilus]